MIMVERRYPGWEGASVSNFWGGGPFDSAALRSERMGGGAAVAEVGLTRSFDCAPLRCAPFRFAQDERRGAALRAGGGGWRACPLWLAYAGPSTSTSLHSAQNEWAGALRWRRLAWPGPSTALHSAVLRSASLRPFDAAQDARRGAAPLKIPVGGGLAHLGWSTLGPHPSTQSTVKSEG